MRIAIAGIVHETNTYCKEPTELSDFQILRGEQLNRLHATDTQVGGAMRACDELGITSVPIFTATTQPSGTISFDAYSSMKEEILDGIAGEMPVDGVFMDLHGAGVVDGLPDLEGDLAVAIRELVGDGVPITAAFDLHGNVTQQMADAMNGVYACHQYPHIDTHERAREAVHLIHRINSENLETAVEVVNVPMLMPTTTTFHGPGREMLDEVLGRSGQEEVINVSWFHGFPYTDVPHVGSQIAVTAVGRETARSAAQSAAQVLWDRRETFRPVSLSAEEAVAEARKADAYPVVMNETSDNCGGGTPGDGTHLLKAMLDAKLENACFGFLVDAEVAEQAHRAGVGSSITVHLGGKYDDLHGDTLVLDVYVKALHDGKCVMTTLAKGSRINYGKLARLTIGDFDIIVASNRSQTFDTEPFIAVGIDVLQKKYVALKSSNHFRAGFEPIAGTIITADPPGLTTHHVEIFPRQRSAEPLWPIDDKASFWSGAT